MIDIDKIEALLKASKNAESKYDLISGLNPKTVLALIERIRILETQVVDIKEQELLAHSGLICDLRVELEQERNRIRILEEACEFYADTRSWLKHPSAEIAREIIPDDCDNVPNYARWTGGEMARKALEESKKL